MSLSREEVDHVAFLAGNGGCRLLDLHVLRPSRRREEHREGDHQSALHTFDRTPSPAEATPIANPAITLRERAKFRQARSDAARAQERPHGVERVDRQRDLFESGHPVRGQRASSVFAELGEDRAGLERPRGAATTVGLTRLA